MPEPKRPLKVFLCHAHADRDAVRALYRHLTTDGVDAWLDKEKLVAGQDWEYEIRKAVRESDVVVVCHSKQFNQRGFRQKEVKIALEEADLLPKGEIFIIPARLEMCNVLDDLKRWHWVDLFEKDGYENLIRALRLRADRIDATLPIKRSWLPKISSPLMKKQKPVEIKEAKTSEKNLLNTIDVSQAPSEFPDSWDKERQPGIETDQLNNVEKADHKTAREKAKQEEPELRVAQITKLKESIINYLTSLKSTLFNTSPFLRISTLAGITILLLWVGLLAITRFVLPISTPNVTATLALNPSTTFTPESILPIVDATSPITPSPTYPTYPTLSEWLERYPPVIKFFVAEESSSEAEILPIQDDLYVINFSKEDLVKNNAEKEVLVKIFVENPDLHIENNGCFVVRIGNIQEEKCVTDINQPVIMDFALSFAILDDGSSNCTGVGSLGRPYYKDVAHYNVSITWIEYSGGDTSMLLQNVELISNLGTLKTDTQLLGTYVTSCEVVLIRSLRSTNNEVLIYNYRTRVEDYISIELLDIPLGYINWLLDNQQ